MPRHILSLAFVTAFLIVAADAQNAPDLKTEKEKVSYALGMQMGADLHKQELDLDLAALMKGLQQSFSGGNTLLTEDEMRSVLANAKQEYNTKKAALREQQAATMLKSGEEFLAENKKKEGVITLPTGLQYKILKEGIGDRPMIDEKVVCNYRGMLLDGTEFDSSEKHDPPVTFPVRGVIEGWREALLRMQVGSKWELFVPAQLAYGKAGAPSIKVPPNATLRFELELVAVKENEKERRDRE